MVFEINWIKPDVRDEIGEYFENEYTRKSLATMGISFNSEKELINVLESGQLIPLSKKQLLDLQKTNHIDNMTLSLKDFEEELKDVNYSQSFNDMEKELKEESITLPAPILFKIGNNLYGFSGNRRTNLAMKYNLPLKFWVVSVDKIIKHNFKKLSIRG